MFSPRLSLLVTGICCTLGQCLWGFEGSHNCGTYAGVQLDGDPAAITLTLTERGTYSAGLRLQGLRISFGGHFEDEADTSVAIRFGSSGLLSIQLHPDYTNDAIYVVVDPQNQNGLYQNLYAGRAAFNARTNPAAAFAGRYTMVIHGYGGDPTVPAGDGFAAISVDAGGRVRASGKLADGSIFTQTSPLFADRHFPFFVTASGGKVAAGGWIGFFSDGGNDVEGQITWNRQAEPNSRVYPNGFIRFSPKTIGSRYSPPASRNQRVLNLTNLLVTLDSGTSPGQVENLVTLTDNNKVFNNSTNRLGLTLRLPTGLFSGWVIPSGSTSRIPIQGALLQQQNSGSGFFPAGDQSGRVTIVPQGPLLPVTVIEGPTTLLKGAAGDFVASTTPATTDCQWDFGDGTIVGNTLFASHAWTNAGTYTVSVHVSSPSDPNGVAATSIIQVIDSATP